MVFGVAQVLRDDIVIEDMSCVHLAGKDSSCIGIVITKSGERAVQLSEPRCSEDSFFITERWMR